MPKFKMLTSDVNCKLSLCLWYIVLLASTLVHFKKKRCPCARWMCKSDVCSPLVVSILFLHQVNVLPATVLSTEWFVSSEVMTSGKFRTLPSVISEITCQAAIPRTACLQPFIYTHIYNTYLHTTHSQSLVTSTDSTSWVLDVDKRSGKAL